MSFLIARENRNGDAENHGYFFRHSESRNYSQFAVTINKHGLFFFFFMDVNFKQLVAIHNVSLTYTLIMI